MERIARRAPPELKVRLERQAGDLGRPGARLPAPIVAYAAPSVVVGPIVRTLIDAVADRRATSRISGS